MTAITSTITRKFKTPNIEDYYGPYTSVGEAHSVLSSNAVGLNIIGYTVGIQPTGSNTITEYWYQGGTEESNLVFKNGVAGNTFCVASKMGMIPNDSTKAAHNGSILDAILAKGIDLIVDDYFFINSGHSFNYDLTIKGSGTIDTTAGSSEGFLILASGASLTVQDISLKLYHSYASAFIKKLSANFLIDHIRFINCNIKNGRPVNIKFTDYNAETTKWGINTVEIIGNKCESLYYGFLIDDCAFYKTCIFSNNKFEKCVGSCFSHATDNNFTYSSSNMRYECDIVVTSNILDNTGYVLSGDASNSYNCLAIVESNRCVYKNNVVTDLIVEHNIGTAYDCYLSCVEVVYTDNVSKNVFSCAVDTSSTNTWHAFAYSKQVPAVSEFQVSKRIVTNNTWENDFNYIREQINTVYTDARWKEITNDTLCIRVALVNDVIIKENTFISNGTFRCGPTDGYVENLIVENNVFTANNIANNYFFATGSSLKTCYIIGNVITTTDNARWNIIAYNYNNSDAEIVVRNNTLANGNLNPMTVKSLIFEGNTNAGNIASVVKATNKKASIIDFGYYPYTNLYIPDMLFTARFSASPETTYNTQVWYDSSTVTYKHFMITIPFSSITYEFILEINTGNYYIYNTNGAVIAQAATNSPTQLTLLQLGYNFKIAVCGDAEYNRIKLLCSTYQTIDNYEYYIKCNSITNKNYYIGNTVSGGLLIGATKVTDAIQGYDGVKWIESDGAVAGVSRSGQFENKPIASNIYVGFRYFCTDRQTTEGGITGIDIIHKGHNIWVDALGRVLAWGVTNNLTNLVSNGALSAEAGESYTAKLTAKEGYLLPSGITIVMGATTLTLGTDYTYDDSTGEIEVIGNGGVGGVSDNLTITATATSA